MAIEAEPTTVPGGAYGPLQAFVNLGQKVINWGRKNSIWPLPFATACCGIEFMATAASRHDLARFGMEAIRFSPRQADVLVVAGRVPMKIFPVMKRIWQQMVEPKWLISMGACCSSGGEFDTYAVVQGIDRLMPVDVYIPGCPPRPEQVLRALMDLQEKVSRMGLDAEKLDEMKGRAEAAAQPTA